MSEIKLAIVIPCYNEQDVLPYTIEKLSFVIDDLVQKGIITKESFLFFVDDGSKDKTWEILAEANKHSNGKIKCLKFTSNFGNQSSILAGLESAKDLGADCAITIDADLQQDETKIIEFVQKFQKGAEIVCGIRKNRKTDSLFKKFASLMFYKLMNILGTKIPANHSEYRLVSRKALDILSKYQETNMFLRGLFFELGLKTDYVYYDEKIRQYGQSKFNTLSLARLAAKGITSFSFRPLRFIFFVGFAFAFVSFLIVIAGILHLIFLKRPLVPGLELFEIFESFFAGLQILCIGIIGEYVGQILQEVKARPRYVKDIELH